MSNSARPRVLKLKKLPKGKFRWKVCFKLQPGSKMGAWDRYSSDQFELRPEVLEYLQNNLAGRYCLGEIRPGIKSGYHRNLGKYKKHGFVWFEHQLDVTMFKLCFGDLIRRIYKVEIEE